MVKYLRGIYNCKAFTNDVNRFNVVEKKSENNTFANFTEFDEEVVVSIPNNFVELKAGGLQIVSDSNKFVRAPRVAAGLSGKQTLFNVVGGNLVSDDIHPNTSSSGSVSYTHLTLPTSDLV